MTISISIARPQTRSSGPKCLSEGRSRSTATNESHEHDQQHGSAGPEVEHEDREQRRRAAGSP